jgi:hypothetical protein
VNWFEGLVVIGGIRLCEWLFHPTRCGPVVATILGLVDGGGFKRMVVRDGFKGWLRD